MNALEKKLEELNPSLLSRFNETKKAVTNLLSQYNKNFPEYTDHSVNHTMEVFKLASLLLDQSEIDNLNEDEIYVLSMACLLHDVGMCIPKSKILKLYSGGKDKKTAKTSLKIKGEDFIRDIHHVLSYDFILKEQNKLKIPSKNYAKAIALVAKGHRKVDLGDINIYEPRFYVKSGKEFVCLPYLTAILRIADELDITNVRTPELLVNYYKPGNEKSVKEWEKHIATSQINFIDETVKYEVTCHDHDLLAALQQQESKIQDTIIYCQKIIHNISNTSTRRFGLILNRVKFDYSFDDFDPKGIKFTFDVKNVVKTFIGEDLYKNKLTTLREALQNSIDTCRYKKCLLKDKYIPKIKVALKKDRIIISDNGQGMDEFIVEHFFGRLGSSFYELETVKKGFEAIGQFGVGLFSYFLISEYIEVETKTETGKTLKFEIDKDPQNYFHFSDKAKRKEAGTTITLYLKPEIQRMYTYDDYINYLNSTFRYIEIPIEVYWEGNKTILKCRKFKLDEYEEINSRLDIQHSNEGDKFHLVKCYINNDEIEGECAVILLNKLKDIKQYELSFKFDNDSFKSISYGGNSQISISQKGVYVNNYSSNLLVYTLGSINLKKPQKININRNEFSDSFDIQTIINCFVSKIIETVFSNYIRDNRKFGLSEYTDDFIKLYLQSDSENFLNLDNYKPILSKYFHCKVFYNQKFKEYSYFEVYKQFKDFILATNIDEYVYLNKKYDLPIILGGNYEYRMDGFNFKKETFIRAYNYIPSILFAENKGYQKMSISNSEKFTAYKNILNIFSPYSFYNVEEINNNSVAIDISKNKLGKEDYYSGLPILNSNHPFVKFYINNHNEIIRSSEFYKIFKIALNIIENITCYEESKYFTIKGLNKILKPLNKIGEPYYFTEKDFHKTDRKLM